MRDESFVRREGTLKQQTKKLRLEFGKKFFNAVEAKTKGKSCFRRYDAEAYLIQIHTNHIMPYP